MPDFIQHLEKYLGEIGTRFSPVRSEEDRPFQILSFAGSPFPEATTIVTAGLAGHVLGQPRKPDVRQELVACTFQEAADVEFAGIVDLVGSQVLENHRALLRGQVIGPAGPLVDSATVEAVVCASPWYWREGFERFDGMNPAVLLVWLVPISKSEARFVRDKGIDAFEQMVAETGPDLLNLYRPSMI